MTSPTLPRDRQAAAEERRIAIIGLLTIARDLVQDELMDGLVEDGYEAIREGHGCVFGNLSPEGDRLTDLAERARLTKQAVGEVVADLERLGYVKRSPDPADGRAKIISLTPRGAEVQAAGRRIMEAVEARWAERYGAERVAVLRGLLEEIAASELGPGARAGDGGRRPSP